MELTARHFVAGERVAGEGPFFHAVDAATGKDLSPAYPSAGADLVNRAVAAAAAAFETYRDVDGPARARFLRRIAERFEARIEDLVERMPRESGLPEPRVRGEAARTAGQFRMFADLVESDAWRDPRHDAGDPDRSPLPKPDVRSLEVPLGPVAVFGPSNFPLAYSVGGGDTASALAAGCPVIVKAHPAHPGVSEIVGDEIGGAVADEGLPGGVFSLLFDAGLEAGERLVTHPGVKAVGFTGSRRGGRAIMDLAAGRPEPIPVYAEMSSVNPVFVLPGALAARGAVIAEALHASVTTGLGQFCTCPGLVFLVEGEGYEPFRNRLAELMDGTSPGDMLTPGIHDAFQKGTSFLGKHAERFAGSDAGSGPASTGAAAFATTAGAVLGNPGLADEVFGPCTLVIRCGSVDEMVDTARTLEGQLTGTLHAEESDSPAARRVLGVLETKVGRIVWNGVPTGVEVGPAMVHGGPYPATSDGRATAVGTRAIHRFTRLVAYQDLPEDLLPAALRG
jgi:NADP-dependent aldehyde dehydrogenase